VVEGSRGLASLGQSNRQGDHTLLLALGCEQVKLGRQDISGSLQDLAQGDGCESNGGIGRLLVIEDFDVQLLVFGLEVLQGQGLVPDGALASVLLDGGLLERLVVLVVKGDLGIRVVLAKVLMEQVRLWTEEREER